MGHKQSHDHTDLVRKWEKVKQSLDVIKQTVKDPVSGPVSVFVVAGRSFLAECGQHEKGLISGVNQVAEEVDQEQKNLADSDEHIYYNPNY